MEKIQRIKYKKIIKMYIDNYDKHKTNIFIESENGEKVDLWLYNTIIEIDDKYITWTVDDDINDYSEISLVEKYKQE